MSFTNTVSASSSSSSSPSYRCSSLTKYSGKKGNAARKRRKQRRQGQTTTSKYVVGGALWELSLSNVLLNESFRAEAGKLETKQAIHTKYKLLGALKVLEQVELESQVEEVQQVEEVEEVQKSFLSELSEELAESKLKLKAVGTALVGFTTLFGGLMWATHFGSPQIRCNLQTPEAIERGLENPASICYKQ